MAWYIRYYHPTNNIAIIMTMMMMTIQFFMLA
jgi:hypothetical protein